MRPARRITAEGLILWYAPGQRAAAITNLFYVESVIPDWKKRFPFFFEHVPQVSQERVRPPEAPGPGLIFQEGLFEREDVIVRTIAEA